LDVQVLGISIDHIPCLQAWAESLGGIQTFPLLSDFWPHGEVAKKYGAFREHEGRSERAIFIIDKDGYIRYIDIHDIDDQPDNDVLFAELVRIIPDGEAKLKAAVKQPENVELPHGGVVLYCTPWCPSCRSARDWLSSNDIHYIEVNVNSNPVAADYVRKFANGNVTTPTFDIDGQIVVDFDLPKLKKILKVGD
jgi:glutaredoxin